MNDVLEASSSRQIQLQVRAINGADRSAKTVANERNEGNRVV